MFATYRLYTANRLKMASLANLPVLPELPAPDTTTMEVILSGADDWHHHLRDGDVLPFTTSCAASQVF